MTAQPATKKRPKLLIVIGILVGICVLCIIASLAMDALGLLPATSPPAQVIPSLVSTNTQPIIPTGTSRCVPASAQQMEYIRSGIKGIQQSNDVLQGFAVLSNDYERVWFVAAEITGPAIQPKQAIGLWAINGELDAPGIILSVNGFAQEFTPYPDGTTTDAQTSQFDDGAQEVLACATDN